MLKREFVAEARVTLRNAQHVVAELCEHMREHDADVTVGLKCHQIRLGEVRADFNFEDSDTIVSIVAPNLDSLYFARMSIASHILEFAGREAPEIIWVGDGRDIARPPNFHILEVVARQKLTPHMLRLTFSADNVVCFSDLKALHVNLMLQHPEALEPQWPSVGANGVISWEKPELRPTMRKYTIRSVDVSASTLDIDFVLHNDAGPGSMFAQDAEIGDRIGIIGPGGGGLAEADWYLFLGDETALPAIARMMENLPLGSRGKAIIEVADCGEVQSLPVPTGFDTEWLFRAGRSPSANSQLIDAVKLVKFPAADENVYVWAGCEFETFRTIRSFMRKDRCLTTAQHLVVSYWRRGCAEED